MFTKSPSLELLNLALCASLQVRLEAFMWGAGTALGELPPYFMARAARLSGALDEEDLEVLEEIRALETADRAQLSWINRIKLFVENLIQKVRDQYSAAK